MEGIFLHTGQGLHVILPMGTMGGKTRLSYVEQKGMRKGVDPESCQWSNIKNRVRLFVIQVDHFMKLLIFNVFPDCPPKIFFSFHFFIRLFLSLIKDSNTLLSQFLSTLPIRIF